MNPSDSDASRFKSAATDRRGERDLDDLLVHVARGATEALEAVYDRLVGPVYGVTRRVLRDPSQSEEVTQEVLLEVWRTAARFDPAMGGAATWVMTIAHRRAIDRVRSTTAAADREHKTAEFRTPHDEVAEAVEASLDRERVRLCLNVLTEVQRESIILAYYRGDEYPPAAAPPRRGARGPGRRGCRGCPGPSRRPRSWSRCYSPSRRRTLSRRSARPGRRTRRSPWSCRSRKAGCSPTPRPRAAWPPSCWPRTGM